MCHLEKHFYFQQERVPVGWVPPACADRMCFFNSHQMSAPVGAGPHVNFFQEICSLNQQMSSLVVPSSEQVWTGLQSSPVHWGPIWVGEECRTGSGAVHWWPISWACGEDTVSLYSEVPCPKRGCTVRSNASNNGVMVTWDHPVNRQTWLKTLTSRNFVSLHYLHAYSHVSFENKQAESQPFTNNGVQQNSPIYRYRPQLKFYWKTKETNVEWNLS